MSFAQSLRQNGPFVGVMLAIAVTAIALVVAVISLLARM
jgi:hypothetical protein